MGFSLTLGAAALVQFALIVATPRSLNKGAQLHMSYGIVVCICGAAVGLRVALSRSVERHVRIWGIAATALSILAFMLIFFSTAFVRAIWG